MEAHNMRRRMHRLALTGVSAMALAAGLTSGPAHAIQFNRGELRGSFDTTITVGALFRVQDQANDLVGWTNGGSLYTFNGDDGNLNYDKGLASLAGRVTHDLKLDWRGWGAFIRGTYFYDVVNAQNSSDNFARTGYARLPGESVERVGRDIELLDAFIYGRLFDTADIRLGNQVLSWGESTFIPNGINTVNPVNVSALRIPGSELKEAFVPVPLVDVSVPITFDLSVEAFYQFAWDKTEPEAYGSLFSTTDAGSPGARGLLLSFGNPNADIPGFTDSLAVPQVTPVNPLGARILRTDDNEPRDSGQFGVAVRYFAEALGGSELGAYFVNYHSRLPVLEYTLPTQAEFLAALPTAIQAVTDPAAAVVAQQQPGYRSINDSTNYRLAYPEDIQLFGASINTSLPFGISMGAEYSLRLDQPLAIDDTEVAQTVASALLGTQLTGNLTRLIALQQLLGAGLPLEQAQALAAAAGLEAARANVDLYDAYPLVRDLGIDVNDPLGSTAALFGSTVRGYKKFDVSQAQATFTKAFGPMAGANQWILVGEIGANWVHNLPDGLKLDGPGTDLTYVPAIAGQGGAPAGLFLDDGFATEFSWGYRLVARFDYLNAFSNVNLFPSVSFAHDVQGVTPSPLGNFVEERMALSAGVRAVMAERWTFDLSYSSFFGAGKQNLVRDRDFVAASVKYSF